VPEKKKPQKRHVSFLHTFFCKSHKWSLFRNSFFSTKKSTGTLHSCLGI